MWIRNGRSQLLSSPQAVLQGISAPRKRSCSTTAEFFLCPKERTLRSTADLYTLVTSLLATAFCLSYHPLVPLKAKLVLSEC